MWMRGKFELWIKECMSAVPESFGGCRSWNFYHTTSSCTTVHIHCTNEQQWAHCTLGLEQWDIDRIGRYIKSPYTHKLWITQVLINILEAPLDHDFDHNSTSTPMMVPHCGHLVSAVNKASNSQCKYVAVCTSRTQWSWSSAEPLRVEENVQYCPRYPSAVGNHTLCDSLHQSVGLPQIHPTLIPFHQSLTLNRSRHPIKTKH